LAPSVLYYTHQVLELPLIATEITLFILHQARCWDCRQDVKAPVPPVQATGYGPRFMALIGEVAGVSGTSRCLRQTFCPSVLRKPLSLGALQKVLDRVSEAIGPHYEAIATAARSAQVTYIDETSWLLHSRLQWLWVMISGTVGFYLIHLRRSKEAFAALINDWAGLLVSDGYGVYQPWVAQRQTCLAHLMRTARSLAEHHDTALAACGQRAVAELHRLCHMAKAPLQVGSGGPGMPGCVN
jgi:transposase